LKDSKSYSISSFNSTIPTGKKSIDKVITSENSSIFKQMEIAGNNVYSLSERDVFYLIRGRKQSNLKVCLVHGSFFETISKEKLISYSFLQVFEERMKEKGKVVNDDLKELIYEVFSEQNNFSKVRNVEKASVKLRFRIMTEVKTEGNLLNSKKYPEILDNTLNLLVPCHCETDEKLIKENFKSVFAKEERKEYKIFKIKHHLNGFFIVFQTSIKKFIN